MDTPCHLRSRLGDHGWTRRPEAYLNVRFRRGGVHAGSLDTWVRHASVHHHGGPQRWPPQRRYPHVTELPRRRLYIRLQPGWIDPADDATDIGHDLVRLDGVHLLPSAPFPTESKLRS